jgi:hypothetical protein
MNKEWIDFSIPKNQVVAKFWDSPDEKVKTRFFHQLLLAVELHLRIQHVEHLDDAKRTLIQTLPPKVLWDLALAQRWLENVGIEQRNISSEDCEFQFLLRSKKRQKNALKHFARLLKWPNMEELEYVLEEQDRHSTPIEEKSADTMCWFTGVILPGPTLPFVLMNSLIDCDEDTGEYLRYLTHVNASCGFQYRANTYWSYKCVLGKVLGASRGVRQVSGWIGPCQFSPDLDRAQCVLIPAATVPKSSRHLSREDVEQMRSNTDSLGPDDLDDYFVRDFDVPCLPDADPDDTIRMQKIAFQELPPDLKDLKPERKRKAKPHAAAVVFAVAGHNLSIRLKYDVDFVAAAPCESGPHPLFRGYRTRMVRVEDGLRDMAGWSREFTDNAGRGGGRSERALVLSMRQSTTSSNGSGRGGPAEGAAASEYYEADWLLTNDDESVRETRRRLLTFPSASSPYSDDDEDHDIDDDNTTLVVDASGVSDNEVFARAWCAHWGEHAVVANLKDCCIACAVREAKACRARVVVVTEGGTVEEKDRGVWDLLSTVG